MGTGSVQRRNDEMVSLLEADFCRWREFMADGARLLSAVQATHRQGGGELSWAWMADSSQNWGRGYLTGWTRVAIAAGDFAATANGGPYADFDGEAEALYITDASWQEALTEELLVWHWCSPASLAADIVLTSKYDINLNNRSWWLRMRAAGPNFEWTCNALGAVVNNVVLNSTRALTADDWYFVAGYIKPSVLMRIYVGEAADAALTIDSLAVGVPAGLFNGSAPLAIGTSFNVAPTLLQPWRGNIGVGHGRFNVPAGTAAAYPEIDSHVSRLFHMTRWKYMA